MKQNKVDDKTAYENLLVKYAELENKIADIKANCDLAIEGREIKIKELELELTVEKDQHQEEINLHLHAEEYIKSLEHKLEQTEKDLADYQFNYPKIKELEQENNNLLDVINNQDVKIADLESENAELKEQNRKKEYQEENYLNKIDHKEEVIKTLQEMIEKMKCCTLCNNYNMNYLPYWCRKNCVSTQPYEKCKCWEIKENG